MVKQTGTRNDKRKGTGVQVKRIVITINTPPTLRQILQLLKPQPVIRPYATWTDFDPLRDDPLMDK